MTKMILIEEEKVQQALEALEFYDKQGIGRIPGAKAIAAMREALAEQPAQQQEPVEVTYQEAFETMQALHNGTLTQQAIAVEFGKTKLYTSPPASKPLPFNKEDLAELDNSLHLAYKLGWKAAEAAHGIIGETK